MGGPGQMGRQPRSALAALLAAGSAGRPEPSLEEMAEILSALATQEGDGSGNDAAGRLAGFLEKAVYQRAKMARNLAQAAEFIQRLSGQVLTMVDMVTAPWCSLHSRQARTPEKRVTKMAADYDEARPDVRESQENSLEALQSANAPDARSVVRELDEADAMDDAVVPEGEFVVEELIVEVIPQAEDEFTCYSCFLVRHRSQIALEKNGHAYCIECEE
jgi:hypothetical protein